MATLKQRFGLFSLIFEITVYIFKPHKQPSLERSRLVFNGNGAS